ncbi:MAG: DUF1345 domain-containing protein [Micrococcales bacterium]|nr:DUF1345 domain-containing protein [Micrococcales bacterium]
MAIAALAAGVPAGAAAGIRGGPLSAIAFGIPVGWTAACLAFLLAVFLAIRGYDAQQTREHATIEDPGRRTVELLCLTASVVSVLAIVGLVVATRGADGLPEVVVAVTAVVSVAASWTLIHVIYMLSYARIYYRGPVGGIDFNTDEPPRYVDFAYLAFDLGMTYQVSDTSLRTSELRGVVLGHTLLSYLFGVVVLASVINLVVGLG